MGKFDLAEKYFKRLLEQLLSDDPLIYNLYEDLTELTSQAGDYDTSIQWRQKLIEFEEQTQLSDKFTQNKTKGSVGKLIEKVYYFQTNRVYHKKTYIKIQNIETG
jgi:tetratricopeptide (TPR) repeat protein